MWGVGSHRFLPGMQQATDDSGLATDAWIDGRDQQGCGRIQEARKDAGHQGKQTPLEISRLGPQDGSLNIMERIAVMLATVAMYAILTYAIIRLGGKQ